MKFVNFGSLNFDQVFSLPRIVKPGETLGSFSYEEFLGGKGFNQSIALARSGSPQVYHAGCIGIDGKDFIDRFNTEKIDSTYIVESDIPTGRAIIQVDKEGENCIILFSGSNKNISKKHIERTFDTVHSGDVLLLQNEISNLGYILEIASSKGLSIVFNPSPFEKEVLSLDLDHVSLFVVNEIEGREMTDKTEPKEILSEFKKRFPNADVLLTLGNKGSLFMGKKEIYSCGIYNLPVLDTTAAGDTFTGYFVSSYFSGSAPELALKRATLASSLAVSKKGASVSIPTYREVLELQHSYEYIEYRN